MSTKAEQWKNFIYLSPQLAQDLVQTFSNIDSMKAAHQQRYDQPQEPRWIGDRHEGFDSPQS
jgi:hypothetical protein